MGGTTFPDAKNCTTLDHRRALVYYLTAWACWGRCAIGLCGI